MRNKFTLRCPSFMIIPNILLLFSVILLITFAIYREEIFFLGFWIMFGSFMGIVLLPTIAVITLMQYSVTFDILEKRVIYRRWFYKKEIPFSSLEVGMHSREDVALYWILHSLASFILYFLLGKAGKLRHKLYIYDDSERIYVAESIFRDKIEKIRDRIRSILSSA